MVIIFENGRLGNQLFQCIGIKRFFTDHKIIFFGCKDLDSAISLTGDTFINWNFLNKRIFSDIFRSFFYLLARVRVFGEIYEITNEDRFSLKIRKGLVPNLFVLRDSFFQHGDIVNDISKGFELRPEIVERAKKWLLNNVPTPFVAYSLIFVHVRRGDYLTWPNAKMPAVLSLSWYSRAMSTIGSKVNNPIFIVLTDDPYYAIDVFQDEKNILISNNDSFVDLALMSLCEHGILSASSFAWWGGWFSKNNKTKLTGHEYIAPNFWAGHRSGRWFPEKFNTDWITYVD